jgi:hypothetical protein
MTHATPGVEPFVRELAITLAATDRPTCWFESYLANIYTQIKQIRNSHENHKPVQA